mgnify:CR=1 FL=1
MPKHYTVKKAMAGTKTASEERMLAKNMGSKKMPGGGKAPMFMMGGKTYADMGAMIKANAGSLIEGLAKNPKTRAQMEKAVGKE